MADFKAQLGRADHPGLASQAERLARIVPGPKPSVTGQSLPPDSPVFCGRERERGEAPGRPAPARRCGQRLATDLPGPRVYSPPAHAPAQSTRSSL